jgi:hypothetical protein
MSSTFGLQPPQGCVFSGPCSQAGNQFQLSQIVDIITFEVQCIDKCAKKQDRVSTCSCASCTSTIKGDIQAPTLNNKILATILAAKTLLQYRIIRPNLGQLALQRLNLRGQGLHLLGLRRDRLGLLGDQILDFLNFAMNGTSGQAGLAGGRGGGGSLRMLEPSRCRC